jgi:hypothetical protein
MALRADILKARITNDTVLVLETLDRLAVSPVLDSKVA